MKNRKFAAIAVAVLVLTIAALLMTGCVPPIATPKVSYDEKTATLSWEAVEGASDYEIRYGDRTVLTSSTSYVFTEYGEFTVKVRAISGVSGKSSSAFSKELKIKVLRKLEKPSIKYRVLYGGKVAVFIKGYDPESSYEVKADGVAVTADASGVFVFQTDKNGTVTCRATGDGNTTVDSDEAVLDYVYKENVHAPIATIRNVGEDLSVALPSGIAVKAVEYAGIAVPYTVGGGALHVDAAAIDALVRADVTLYVVLPGELAIEIKVTSAETRAVAFNGEYVSVELWKDSCVIPFKSYFNDIKYAAFTDRDGNVLNTIAADGSNFTRSGHDGRFTFDTAALPDGAVYVVIGYENALGAAEARAELYIRTEKEVYLVRQLLNYGYGSGRSLDIKFNNSVKITDVSLIGLNASDYTVGDNGITLAPNYLAQFKVGAKLSGKVYCGDLAYDFTVSVVSTTPVDFIGDALSYSVGGGDLAVNFASSVALYNRVAVDGVSYAGVLVGSGGAYTVDDTILKGLNSGRYEIRFFARNGYDIAAVLNVSDGATPYGVTADWDNNYPNVKVTWRGEVGDSTFISVDGREIAVDDASAAKREFIVNSSYFSDMTATYTVKVIGVDSDGRRYESAGVSYTYPSAEIKLSLLTSRFNYLGDEYDLVITSERELLALYKYMLTTVPKMAAYKSVSFDDLPWESTTVQGSGFTVLRPRLTFNITSDRAKELVTIAQNEYSEAAKYSYIADMTSGDILQIGYSFDSTNVPDQYVSSAAVGDKYAYETAYKTKNPRPASYDGFAINSADKTMPAYISDDLYFALQSGVRPVPVAGSPAERMYDTMLDILREIVDDGMTDFEKYRAIWEYVVTTSLYDHNTAKASEGVDPSADEYTKFYSKRCFYLEGVFYDGLAVCNGLAKAVASLCGVEGIECVKVNGDAYSDAFQPPLKIGAHAWNKVKLGGAWYGSDPTWGLDLRSSKSVEAMNGGYMLVSTYVLDKEHDDNGAAHDATKEALYGQYYTADSYGYGANDFTVAEVNGVKKVYSHNVATTEETRALLAAILNGNNDSFITIRLSGAASRVMGVGVVKNEYRDLLRNYEVIETVAPDSRDYLEKVHVITLKRK